MITCSTWLLLSFVRSFTHYSLFLTVSTYITLCIYMCFSYVTTLYGPMEKEKEKNIDKNNKCIKTSHITN